MMFEHRPVYSGGPLDGCIERPHIVFPRYRVWPAVTRPETHYVLYELNIVAMTYEYQGEFDYAEEPPQDRGGSST